MKLFEALRYFETEDNKLTRKELKKLFRKLTLKNHPDHGGDTEMMRLIIEAFEVLKEQYSFVIEVDKEFEEDENYWKIDDPEMEKVYKSIYHFENIKIEICGYWMWVTGETYPYRSELKNAGLFYARKKVAWYWKPADKNSLGRGKASLEYIRKKYGSKSLETTKAEKIC